ncbi:hypothetical protein [Devosia marina]|uniref:Uncharacterized protein n=1 Tax=Devosia marina TaxID=2683198 RepID=A0A7X3K2W9_9HYPH|nr:hypothetical protein [Devosia marina]MVS98887.1 hypothetical protein [Devosia marina]
MIAPTPKPPGGIGRPAGPDTPEGRHLMQRVLAALLVDEALDDLEREWKKRK